MGELFYLSPFPRQFLSCPSLYDSILWPVFSCWSWSRCWTSVLGFSSKILGGLGREGIARGRELHLYMSVLYSGQCCVFLLSIYLFSMNIIWVVYETNKPLACTECSGVLQRVWGVVLICKVRLRLIQGGKIIIKKNNKKRHFTNLSWALLCSWESVSQWLLIPAWAGRLCWLI